MAFPDVIPTSQPQASALLSNNALNAGLTNLVPLDRLTNVEQVVGNLLTSLPATLGTVANQPAKYTKNTTSGATTAAAGDMTGAYYVVAEYSAVGAAALTTRTAVQLFADNSAFTDVGDTYMLLIVNTSGGTTTLTAGTGVTITGTATLATNTTRLFRVIFTSATAVGLQSVSVGTIS